MCILDDPVAKSCLLTENLPGAKSIKTFVIDFPDPEWSTSGEKYRVNVCHDHTLRFWSV